jgi:hypothetical protein
LIAFLVPNSHRNPRESLRNLLALTGLPNSERYLESIVSKTVTMVFCLAATVALGGCATRRGNAMLTDSAVGAGGGALLGAVAGFNPLVGAAVGGAGGAAVGATTH